MSKEKDLDISVIEEHLKDPLWRLNNLYYIRNKQGKKVLFQLNEAQHKVLNDMWYLMVIPKSRQLGMTTFFTIFYLDQILFSSNKVAGIIAHKQEDMKRIFRGKILFALEHLHPWVKDLVGKPEVETANEIVFKNGSSMFVSLSARSQTLNYLHISEFAYICAHDPGKADEIVRGAINSVETGQMISIESTAEGRGGHFYNIVMEAEKMRRQNSKLTELDFRLFFFPWYIDPNYRIKDSEHVHISAEDKEYFKTLEDEHGIKLDQEQKVWYTKKKKMMGSREAMNREYPTVLEECFSQSLEGAYYSNEVALAYETKRIGFFPYDPNRPVSVAWDLGMNDDTVLIFFQENGEEIRIIDEYSASNYGLNHYSQVLLEKPYRYDKHYLPHDAAVRDLSTGVSREQFLWDLGLRNTQVAPKASVQDGIEKTRQIFHRLRFHQETTQDLLDSLQMYRKEFDHNKGTWKPTPYHDKHSHRADALRVLALMVHNQSAEFYGDDVGGIHIESFAF